MKRNKRTTSVALALVFASLGTAVLFGAYLGKEQDCCVAPQAMQTEAFTASTTLLAALSGPLGGGIALWIAFEGRRQEKSRRKRAKKEQRRRGREIRKGLISELEDMYNSMTAYYGHAKKQKSEKDLSKRVWENQLSFPRPFFEMLTPELVATDPVLSKAIGFCEGKMQAQQIIAKRVFDYPIKVEDRLDKNYDELCKRIEGVASAIVSYLQLLSKEQVSDEVLDRPTIIAKAKAHEDRAGIY